MSQLQQQDQEMGTTRAPRTATAPKAAALGEELPIFCEKCGYSLFGLPTVRCEHCTIVQFHCPECGHHQPINTLRPAFQKVLGRFRAGMILLAVLFKIFVFAMTLIGWFAMGVEWSYRYAYYNRATRFGSAMPAFEQRIATNEQLIGFGIFALAWGMVARMMLLRWKRGYFVGLALAGLAIGAAILGAEFYRWERRIELSPYGPGFLASLLVTLLGTVGGAAGVWGLWLAMAHAFLPRRTAQALVAWQTGLSEKSSELSRQ